ncbi:MAG: TRAP transporter small permease [Granulosicoccus sp.]|nr:TRAP transporter small permease [Granulosicoccus sp.]
MCKPAQVVARWMAVSGGIVLLLLVVLTCLSVAGRLAGTLGHSQWLAGYWQGLADVLQHLGPVTGDFEIVEAGVAFAIMAFFPWCSMQRGHASVDVFTAMLPARVRATLDWLWECVFLLIMVIIAWRLMAGTLSKWSNGQTTFLLEFPVWWGYAATAGASIVACLVVSCMAWARWRDIFDDSPAPGEPASVDH